MKNIEKEIIEQYERYNKTFIKDIREEEEKQNKGESNDLRWYLQRHLTKLAIEKWNNGEITTSEAIEKAIKREKKQNEKAKENALKHLEEIKNAEKVTAINIIVEWKKSQTWGANPHATAQIWTEDVEGVPHYEEHEGSASGCGYDKESAAVGEALNQSKAVIKIFAEYKENALKKDKNADKNTGACTGVDNRNAICYGFGYSPIPYFEGGVGVNCFINGFNLAGFRVTESHGKMSDFYSITRK